MSKLTANEGHGFDHVCSEDASHGVWDPQTNRHGQRCLVFVGDVDGKKSTRCKGKLKIVGRGAKKLTAGAASQAA